MKRIIAFTVLSLMVTSCNFKANVARFAFPSMISLTQLIFLVEGIESNLSK